MDAKNAIDMPGLSPRISVDIMTGEVGKKVSNREEISQEFNRGPFFGKKNFAWLGPIP